MTKIGAPHLDLVRAGLGAQHLAKRYKKRPVLRDVSLFVGQGEAVALLGPNGAGKTTCFYIMTGLTQADGGIITLDGVDITALPMYRRARMGIGYLPQESSIFRGLNVEDNLRAVIELQGLDKRRSKPCLKNCCGNFLLPICGKPRPSPFRGGSGGAWKLPARFVRVHPISFLMNPWRGLTPLPWGKYAPLFAI
jgi:lipopolysaccharide export system ATP-binding protein